MSPVDAVLRQAKHVNRWVDGVRRSPRWGRLLRGWLTEVTYVGRRSGRTITTVVGYRRRGDRVVIRVEMPEAKTWWRNFTGDGSPLTLDLDGGGRTGHAVARRDEKGRVTVHVRLDPQ